ncbi:hypothetical protein IKA15_02810 [bacterium]|nr:hypothetical protein [bacterium]
MKNFYLLIALIIFVVVIWAIFCTQVFLNYAQAALIVYLLGILTGVLFMVRVIISKNAHNDNCKKQLEKVAINSDENSLKIETLENKIQSLEIALKKALEDKN